MISAQFKTVAAIIGLAVGSVVLGWLANELGYLVSLLAIPPLRTVVKIYVTLGVGIPAGFRLAAIVIGRLRQDDERG